jgi:hypothetical protein
MRTQVRIERVRQALRRGKMLVDIDMRDLPHRMHASVSAA